MAKGRRKGPSGSKVKADDARSKGTKENKPEMNGDVLCNGQSTLHSYFSPGNARSPLHDNSIPLTPEGKAPLKYTLHTDGQRQGEVKLNSVKSEGDTSKVEEAEGARCLPCRTEEQQGELHEGVAEVHVEPSPGPGPSTNGNTCQPALKEGARRKVRAKKSNPRTTESKETQNKKVTDYYPVRRSSRKSKTELKSKEQQRINHLINSGIEEGMKVKYIEGKGRGVFAEKGFHKGEFVVEYHGDLLHIEDAKKREATYAQDPSTGCYMYYFQYLSKTYCVDATKETNRLGRLINHSKNGNCQTKLHNINGIPHLILVASRDIEKGEELLYDYGDRSKASIAAYPWLKH
ncbi:N-lysine methyltransferase KMT5A-A isoform X2 [Scleropages formosus]|uniref:[histone H4]-lysine(20) N-methyltransferase n=1 Tax=Scleropages formosus TaxID=113540 RepID=A0A8C9SB43_SCLFO|nr:N-lysine methyltransferase KMT5A isoform X2 [Scleropages formosus]